MYATNRRWSHQYYLYSTFIVLFRFYLFINVFSVNLHPTRDDVIPASVVTSWPPQLWRHVDAPSMLFSFVVFFLFFFLFFFNLSWLHSFFVSLFCYYCSFKFRGIRYNLLLFWFCRFFDSFFFHSSTNSVIRKKN